MDKPIGIKAVAAAVPFQKPLRNRKEDRPPPQMAGEIPTCEKCGGTGMVPNHRWLGTYICCECVRMK